MTRPNTVLLTARQRTAFVEDGYLLLADLVTATTVDQLRHDADLVMERIVGTMMAERMTDPRVTWWRLSTGRPYLLKIKPVLDLAPAAASLATGDQMRSLTADLLGTTPHLMEDKFMYKQEIPAVASWAALPVFGEEVCKHTDAAYFATRGHPRVLTVAVCLDDCTPQSGALRVWPGSHRRDIEMIPTNGQGPVVPDQQAPDTDAVTLATSAGSVLVWDAALVHASGPNDSGNPRRLLVLGYAPAGTADGGP